MNNHRFTIRAARCLAIQGGKILLVRRSKLDSWNPDKWELPGGKAENSESFEQAAWRELYQEAGIFAHKLARMFAHSRRLLDGRTGDLVTEFFFVQSYSFVHHGQVKLSDEHSETEWCDYHNMPGMELTESTRTAVAWLKNFV